MFNKKQRAQKYVVGGKVIHLCASLKKCVFREVTKVDTVADSRILRGNLFQCLVAAALKDQSP